MNKKIIILVLAFAVLVAIAWTFSSSSNSNGNMNGMQMGGSGKAGTHMMKMPDVSMMEMNNGDMMMKK